MLRWWSLARTSLLAAAPERSATTSRRQGRQNGPAVRCQRAMPTASQENGHRSALSERRTERTFPCEATEGAVCTATELWVKLELANSWQPELRDFLWRAGPLDMFETSGKPACDEQQHECLHARIRREGGTSFRLGCCLPVQGVR